MPVCYSGNPLGALPAVPQLLNLNEQGLGLHGYDPVSYWEGQPTPGDENITSSYEGAIYHFANREHKTAFDSNPQRFTPEYGGFCAVAVSEGKTFPIDPLNYCISDERLYLFYNGKLGNTKPQWEQDPQARKASADEHWNANDLLIVYPSAAY